MDTDSHIEILENQIRELYGRVVWTHKTQEKCADIILERHVRIKILQIILSAITTTGILVAIFGENKIIGIISAILSAVLFGLNAYTKDYDLGEIAQKHTSAAIDLWNIRENYLSLLTDIAVKKLGIDEIIERRNELQKDLFNIYSGAPRTINKSYKEATKGLKENEEMTFSTAEIDALLPRELRKNK
jgi:hypothetical protein